MEVLKPLFNPSVLGYCIEYYLQTPNGNRYIDSEVVSEPDREVLGYYGTQYHKTNVDITIRGTNKVIPKNSEYYTRLVKLNGRDPDFYDNVIKVNKFYNSDADS
jgi:hypothetical protein